MRSRLAKKNSGRFQRQGVSIVEFVGCLVAMGGGVMLGSMYLGIDLQGLATDALERGRGIKRYLPEATSEESAEQSPESSKSQSTRDAKTGPAAGEVAEQETVGTSATEDSETYDLELTEAERARATQVYWKAFVACMSEEMAGRKPRGKRVENWQMFDHLENRQVGHQHAADQIKQLDDRGVNEKVLDHAAQVLSWNLAGAQLYQRALDLITEGPSADLLGSFAQSWQSAATQHRMEEKLVQTKHLNVTGYLNHTYKDLGPFEPAVAP